MALTLNRPRQRPAPLYACPTPPDSLAFPTHWYRLPDNDDVLICTKCYEDKLAATPLANVLRCDYLDFTSATCDFNTPRIDALLRQAVASNDFQPLWSFAVQRLSIKSCSGTQGIKGGNDVKWFKPINDDIPHFVCCEACYEDVVLATNFGPHFVSYPTQQPVDQTWSCDLAIPYLRRRLQGCALRGDWNSFVQASHHRMSLPDCVSAAPVFAYTKKWYNTVIPSPIPNMTVCEACYLDRAGWQENMAQRFAQVAVRQYDFQSRWICDFQLIPMAVCSDLLLAHGMFDNWHPLASLIVSKPSCTKEGIVDGEWYGLVDPNDATRNIENFDICAACHAGWNQSAELGHLFRRLSYPSGVSRVCDFNPSAAQYAVYIAKWNQTYFTRNPAPFINYISRFAPLSKCQCTRRLENAIWYGDKDASLLICPWCFEEAVRGTHFASTFPLQNTLLPEGHHCSLYSPRMREKYAEACKQRSLDSLLSFALQREQVYQQTIPPIEVYIAGRQQKMELLKITSQQRAFSKGAISMSQGLYGGTPFVSDWHALVMPHTILYEHQQRDLQNDFQRPALMQLEARWKEVE